MRKRDARNRAGAFAADRYRRRSRAWRRTVAWALPVLVLLPVSVVAAVTLVLNPRHVGFLWGFAIGGGLGALMVCADSPPEYIARWRRGADGEKATARALRPLLRQGWRLFNDIETSHGNIDHVLIGPAGVFVIDSKCLNGRASVRRGLLSVAWHEDPDEGYTNSATARTARWDATRVRDVLRGQGVDISVQPVVVLWSEFEQTSLLSGGVAWVAGRVLANKLEARPRKASEALVALAVRTFEVVVTRSTKPMRRAHLVAPVQIDDGVGVRG